MRRRPVSRGLTLNQSAALLLQTQIECGRDIRELNRRMDQTEREIRAILTRMDQRITAIEELLVQMPETIRQTMGFRPRNP